MVRQECPSVDTTNIIHGIIDSKSVVDSKPHMPERDPLRGEDWVVQKFGGTSVGKYAAEIAEDIVL
jgi:aspartate kinase